MCFSDQRNIQGILDGDGEINHTIGGWEESKQAGSSLVNKERTTSNEMALSF